MEIDIKVFLVVIAAMFQFADITSTNKAIALGLSEGNKFIAKVMEVLNKFWWIIKVVPMWIAFWLVWDDPKGMIIVSALSTVYYYWVVFENNLPNIQKWKERRAKNRKNTK